MPNYAGVKQISSGRYEVRIQVKNKHLNINTIKRLDDDGKPFTTKKAAADYRDAYIQRALDEQQTQPAVVKDCTLQDIYDLYMRNGAYDKAPSTIRKQASMWQNHVGPRFGNRLISSITLNDLQNYLSELYNHGDEYDPEANYSFKYVEGFLKFFYLLFSVAYSAEYISTDRYTKMFLERSTRLTMPKITQEDAERYDDIEIFTDAELRDIDAIFKRGNCYTAYLLGYYCGLRISETFALTWQDFSLLDHTITINKQLLYIDGVWCLSPVKTLTAVRVIDLPPFLYEHLKEKLEDFTKIQNAINNGELLGYRNYEYVIDRTKRPYERLQSVDFINRKENGELLTPNSIKYWAKTIKKELLIDFKYHSLRKSYATRLANLNTPALELQRTLGHKKYSTTMQYYINANALARERLKLNLALLDYQK